MRTVQVNFNRRTDDNNIQLDRVVKTISGALVHPGERIRVTGDDLEVIADIIEREGVLVAIPRWDTLEWTN
jgi:azurin